MSRLARTPISERIKLFNNGKEVKTTTPTTTPVKKHAPSPHNSPVLKPANRSQFSAKDPSNPKGRIRDKVALKFKLVQFYSDFF